MTRKSTPAAWPVPADAKQKKDAGHRPSTMPTLRKHRDLPRDRLSTKPVSSTGSDTLMPRPESRRPGRAWPRASHRPSPARATPARRGAGARRPCLVKAALKVTKALAPSPRPRRTQPTTAPPAATATRAAGAKHHHGAPTKASANPPGGRRCPWPAASSDPASTRNSPGQAAALPGTPATHVGIERGNRQGITAETPWRRSTTTRRE